MFWGPKDEAVLVNLIDHREASAEIVVDPETPLEQLFSIPMVVGVLLLILPGVYLFASMFKSMGLVAGDAGKYFAWGVILTPIGIYVRSLVDVYYLLDLKEEAVYRHRRVFQTGSVRKVCDFSEVERIHVDSAASRQKDMRYSSDTYVDVHRYGIRMVLKNGSSIRLVGRSYLDYRAVKERAAFLARHLKVKVSGTEGARNMGSSAYTTSGCLNGCAVLMLMMMVGTCVTQGKQAEKEAKTKARAAAKAQSTPVKKPSEEAAGQAAFWHWLTRTMDPMMRPYFAKGLVEIYVSDSVWKAIRADDEMKKVLTGTPVVAMAMAYKLNLPIYDKHGHPTPWPGRVGVRVEMTFEEEVDDVDLLRRNLQLAFGRLQMGQPRNGKALLTLRVSPLAHKPVVTPEEYGFTLTIPANHPIKREALGLPDDFEL